MIQLTVGQCRSISRLRAAIAKLSSNSVCIGGVASRGCAVTRAVRGVCASTVSIHDTCFHSCGVKRIIEHHQNNNYYSTSWLCRDTDFIKGLVKIEGH